MSGAAIVNRILSASTAITAIVPAARILTCLELPLRTALPAINVSRISGIPSQFVDGRGRLRVERVQVMVHAATDATKAQLLQLARDAMPEGPGAIGGVWVSSIVVDIEGPDLSQPEAGIFEAPQDFIVNWYEPAA